MTQKDLSQMDKFEDFYWWHKGKVYLLDKLLGFYTKNMPGKELKILELGCGTGANLPTLAKYGEVHGLELSPFAVDICKSKGFNNVSTFDLEKDDFSKVGQNYNFVVALDVFEHLQNDLQTLKNIKSILSEDGYLIVNVPAFKLLWSAHDELLMHKRRYHRHELISKLKSCGYKIVKATFFVTTMFFPIAFYRILSNFFPNSSGQNTSYINLPSFANEILYFILKLETNLSFYFNLPLGSTITAVCQKEKI